MNRLLFGSKRACATTHGEAGTMAESCDPIGKVHALKIRPYLDLVDKLRSCGIERDIPIPQIAVKGDQSSGKSSVLEFISGVPFPRGSGLVTKCATQLTMKKSDKWRSWAVIEPKYRANISEVFQIANERQQRI
jgi:hypothetical protein